MSKAPKYSFRVVEKRNKTWTAEIQRQATSKKKVVSKRQTDFATEAEGVTWAEEQLKEILATLVAKNKRHDDVREEQYKEKLMQAELQAASERLAEADAVSAKLAYGSDSDEDVIAEDVTNEESVVADAEETVVEATETVSDTKTVAKFDFEVELEEAEQAEKDAVTAAKKKAKAAKKVKVEDVVVEDDAPTADGSEEVNSIYLNK